MKTYSHRHRPALCGALLAAVLLMVLTACTTTRYVPLEVTHTSRDTLHTARISRDTLLLRDTIRLDRRQAGDTIYITQTATHWRTRASLRTDTVYLTRTDTIERLPRALSAAKKPTTTTTVSPLALKAARLLPYILLALFAGLFIYSLKNPRS